MAKSVLELAVGTGQWDAGLKKAKSALDNFTHANGGLQKALSTDSDKMQQFVKMMGQMDSTAKTAKGQMNDYKGAIEQLTMQYNRMTDAQKKTIGQDYLHAIDQMKQKYQGVAEEVQKINQSLKSMPEPAAMSGSGVMDNLKGVLNGVAGKFGMSASMFTGVGAAVAGAAGAFKLLGDNVSLAMNFEKSMSQLSSLTGMAGKDLDQLKEYAIELGSTSTLTASQVADAFRLIGSQQPQLLESGQALKEVTKYAITLSEAAGIDLQTAAQTLSTSINQMGGDSNNASRYVNVLAAASQKGAGDIAWLGEAITKSATAAKAVGTDYEELVANLEQLAKAGFDASTAGTALRSIIMNLEKQANNDFKPSIVGLTQAFENLGKANLDIVGYQNIAGKMFASQAMALANAAQEAKNMTAAITGTNTAVDQAKTNTDNLDGALKSLSSAWEGLNLHINASSGFLKDVVDWAAELIRKLDGVATAGGRAAKALRDMNGAGGSEGPTKVDQQIGALRGSKHKRAAFNATMKSYRQQLADYDMKIANGGKWESKDRPGFFRYENVDVLKAQRAALAQMAKEYQTRGLREINPTPAKTDNNGKTTITVDVDVDTDEGEKSLDSLKAKLKELKKLRDEAINKKDFKARDTYNTQIKQTQDEIKLLRGGSTTTTTTHVKPIEEKVAWDANKANIAATKTEDTMPSVWQMLGEKGRNAGIGIISPELSADIEKQQALVDELREKWAGATGDIRDSIVAMVIEAEDKLRNLKDEQGISQGDGRKPYDLGKDISTQWKLNKKGQLVQKDNEKQDPTATETLQGIQTIVGSLQSITLGIETLGIELPKELNDIFGVLQTITGIVGSIQAMQQVGTWLGLFSHGGVVHAANGYVDGNTYSGDQIPAMLNAGEVVLNRSQQGVLAASLQAVGQSGEGGGGGKPYVSGEMIWLGLNNYLNRSGRGEIVTSKRR